MAVSPDLLAILRCPACVREVPDGGLLDLTREVWLICRTCGRKYPIRDDIPVMLIEEGTRWQYVAVEALPAVPPEPVV